MDRTMRRLFLLLLSAAFSASASVTGIVVGDDGAPLAGARVRIFAREPFPAVAARLLSNAPEPVPVGGGETAASGAFAIEAKGNATVDVLVDAPAHDPAAFTAADGDDAGVIVLHARSSRRLRLTLDGKALPNALVYLGRSLLMRTDGQGMYTPIATGEPSFVIHPDAGVMRPAARENDAVLTRGLAVRGRVVGRDGTTAVTGAAITAGGWPLARSGADGAFTITHVPAHVRTLVAAAASDAGVAPVESSKPIVIRLGTAASLGGTVTSARGEVPVGGATVTVSAVGGDEFTAITDGRGRYSIAALPPGNYSESVFHPGYAVHRGARLRVEKAATRAFVLTPRPTVRGTIIGDDRKPVPNALIALAGPMGGAAASGAAVASGPAGEFTFRPPLSGLATVLAVIKPGYATAVYGPLLLEPGQSKSGVTITLARGFPMQIRVVDAEQHPVGGIGIDITASGGEPMARLAIPCGVDRDRCRVTRDDGTYETRLVEGKYNVMVSGDVVPQTLAGQALTARSSPMTIRVDRGTEVSGRVTFRDGTPVAGARVAVRSDFSRTTTADANGQFTLKRLPRAAVTLVATSVEEMPLQATPIDVTPPARDVKLLIPTPARIEGRVVERSTMQPVTSFTVAASRREPGGSMRGTDFNNADGTFVLKRVMAGGAPLELRVTAPGYIAGTVSDLLVEEGAALTGVEVKLDRGARVSGRVTAAGKPLAGAGVRVSNPTGRLASAATQTDGDGLYTLDGVPAGEQTFEFMKQGYVARRKNVELAVGKEVQLDAELDRGRELRGRVTDRAGQPVGGARVVAAMTGARYVATAMSEADGQFTMSGLEDSRLTVTAQKGGYVTAKVENIDPAAAQPLTLTLERGGTISGRVTGLAESELAQVRVSASGEGSSATEQADSSGSFTLTGIPDGRITVVAYRSGARMRQSAPKVIEVVNGTAPPVEIDFAAGITVRGRVTRNGAPAGSGGIAFTPHGGGGHSASSMIGPDGAYEVGGLDPGDYDVHVNMAGNNDTVRYTVTGNATYDIDLRGGAVRGVVLDAATGAPLPDARVFTLPTRERPLYRNAVSDSDGRFVLDTIPDGVVDVRADHEHYAPSTQSVSLNGGAATPIELRLSRGLEAVVRVVDAESGASLTGSVVLTDAQNKLAATGSGRGEDGATHVWVAAGHYTVRVFVPGYIQQSAGVDVPGPEARVALQRGAKLVLSSRSGGRFRLVPPRAAVPAGPGGVVGGSFGWMVGPGERRVIDGLAPGLYSIEKLDSDGKTAIKAYAITLTSGQTATLDAD